MHGRSPYTAINAELKMKPLGGPPRVGSGQGMQELGTRKAFTGPLTPPLIRLSTRHKMAWEGNTWSGEGSDIFTWDHREEDTTTHRSLELKIRRHRGDGYRRNTTETTCLNLERPMIQAVDTHSCLGTAGRGQRSHTWKVLHAPPSFLVRNHAAHYVQ